jgi:hypothetical protein
LHGCGGGEHDGRVKVFLSWSGERSKAMAVGLREWLPLVLHYVEPWMSELDISAGGRWAVEVGRELEASNFGLICLTVENLSASWISFEAGALSKTVEKSSVVPYLLDVDFANVDGPLAQFQAKKVRQNFNAGYRACDQCSSQGTD